MRARYFGLVLSLIIVSGGTATIVWFWLVSAGKLVAYGMMPFVLSGIWMTLFWLHRIFAVTMPGECECGHIRCCHEGGRGACHISYGVSEKFPKGSSCACQLFISRSGVARDPDVEELKKISRVK